jgi:hypothetical protein
MGFFMWPIVTGNVNDTMNRRSTLETVWGAQPPAEMVVGQALRLPKIKQAERLPYNDIIA